MTKFKLVLITMLIFGLTLISQAQASKPTRLQFLDEPLEIAPRMTSGRSISVIGNINESMVLETIRVLKSLDSQNHEEIEINITSPGGSVYAGLALIDVMQSLKSPVKTVCIGYCMSMAASILAAGTQGHRVALKHSTVMIHQISGGAQGNLTELMTSLKEAQRLQAIMTQILSEVTGLSTGRLTRLMDHDHFMSAREAKQLHLIDIIQ